MESANKPILLIKTEVILKNEINYIINNFEDNGYNKKILKNTTKTYTQKKLTMSKEANYKNRLRSSKTKVALTNDENIKKQQQSHISWASNPYIPYLIQQLGKIFIKHDISFHSSSGLKLGDVLCSINKSKHKKMTMK